MNAPLTEIRNRKAESRTPGTTALCLIVAGVLAFAAPGFAETIRVTSWKWGLGHGIVASNLTEIRVQEAAVVLGKLNPDVILLQQVPDWQTCSRLAQALKPANYNILVCSSFSFPNGAPGQVAILAKQKGYFSWSDSWRGEGGDLPGGGFAFAAMRMGSRRVGLFSMLFDETMLRGADAGRVDVRQSTSARARQWRAELDTLSHWVTNRIDAVAVAGAFPGEKDSSAEEQASIDQFVGAPLEKAITLAGERTSANLVGDYFLAQVTPGSIAFPGVVLDRTGVTCDLVVNLPEPVADKPAVPPLALAAASTPTISSAKPKLTAQTSRSSPRVWWPAVLGAVVVAVGLALWRWKRRAALWPSVASPAGQSAAEPAKPGPPASATVVLLARNMTDTGEDQKAPGPASVIHVEGPGLTHTESGAHSSAEKRAVAVMRTGLLALWSQWLKEKLVRKLIAERAALLRTQQAATFKAMAVEERLARVELQVQHQNKAYEERIEELTRELLAAKDENRELIRIQIAQVKSEMEAARARALAQSKKG